MPNTRRRKFSVQHDIVARNAPKMQDVAQSSRAEPDSELRLMAQNLVKFKANKKNKVYQESSISEILEIVSEIESTSSMMSPKTVPSSTMDKDVTANSSNIDLFNLMNTAEQIIDTPVGQKKSKKHNKQVNCEVTPQRGDRVKAFRDTTPRRDKPRQHRVKVRSPKRRVTAVEEPKNEDENKQTTGTNAIDWDQEIEVFITHVTDATKNNEENRASTHSIEDMCRICHGGDALSPELGQLISACSCRGTVGRVHVKCLERWLTESGKSRCELCGTRYATRRVHRYGVPRALVMWILSQNAKQLMVDSLGIMLMSPLAILAAWLSGRTLAGLMTQDSHVTPWPLASTFVLACMTLVCYYCWIVSAATRHALGWWIWYRSQYEVRLQFGNDE